MENHKICYSNKALYVPINAIIFICINIMRHMLDGYTITRTTKYTQIDKHKIVFDGV